jgi:putative mRNA 3-end processing factor
MLKWRLGENNYQSVDWNEPVYLNSVRVTLHPSGHIIGSAQIRVEYKGEVWVAAGDYKTENDGISLPMEIVPCDVFITESTFGLPVYEWLPQQRIYENIKNWVQQNKNAGNNSVLLAYSLGKAQRLMNCLESEAKNVYVHGSIWNTNQALISSGISLPAVNRVQPDARRNDFHDSVILAPPGASNTPWMKRFHPYSLGICSGWMQVRGHLRRSNADAGFALSDHADWKGLLQAVKASGASKIFVTHGFQSAFSRYLNEIGMEAAEVKTEFGDDEEKQPAEDLPAMQ